MESKNLEVRDIVQIDPKHDPCFGGCLMMVTESRKWGVIGCVLVPHGDDPERAYYPCEWADMEYVGRAQWVPQDVMEKAYAR